MLNLAKGYKISVPEKLNEGYEITNDVSISANVNAEKTFTRMFIILMAVPGKNVLS